ncbi:MAG TPA: DUF4255 domain-containing protein [Blastocatellia bacterium]|nr:DUF4255 domain-containing protein [Blastocatellia bacterium]
MSSALAIASVTAVLKDLLNNGLIDHNVGASVGEVTVSTLPPDRVDVLDVAQKKSRLNLFMYQVTANAGWRNVGLPSRNGRGERISNPPLALDLHYLLTSYGAEELHAEILLGYGMQLLYETPVLTRAAIRRSLAPPSLITGGSGLPPEMEALFTSELSEQVEQIKISPASLSTEEISRMWSAFQAKYRPTAVYQASVVLIESKQPTKSPLPVRSRGVYVVPFAHLVIEQIKSQATPGGSIDTGQPILAGQNLVIVGRGLRADDVRVNIGGVEVTPLDADVTDTQIIVPIPASLRAGIQGVQVIHRTLLGEPPTPHRGFESNVAAFVLRPVIIDPIGVSDLQDSGGGLRSANLNLTVHPAIGDTQRVVLMLNEFIPIASPPSEVAAQSYGFTAPVRTSLQSPPAGPTGASETISIPISGVKAGSYLLRVQVDGAESPLGSDAAGQYVSPLVTIS